jgi:hypothetical protein
MAVEIRPQFSSSALLFGNQPGVSRVIKFGLFSPCPQRMGWLDLMKTLLGKSN